MKSSGSDDNGLLTASIFVESVKQQRNDPEFKEAYQQLCHQFFRLRDVNGDGLLQEDEYTKSLDAIGITDVSLGRNVFQSMDLNGDEKISLDEFCSALLEYLISEDENSPFASLWGPMVE
jgi:Ca2+-binding EF-hand superfamily protein